MGTCMPSHFHVDVYRQLPDPFPSEPYRNYVCFGCGWDPAKDTSAYYGETVPCRHASDRSMYLCSWCESWHYDGCRFNFNGFMWKLHIQ